MTMHQIFFWSKWYKLKKLKQFNNENLEQFYGDFFSFSLASGILGGSVVKNLPANAGDVGLIPESGRSPGEGNGNPLQYSCLGNLMHRGTLQATVHGITKSWIWYSDWTTATVCLGSMSRSGWFQSSESIFQRHLLWEDLCPHRIYMFKS